MSKDFQTGFVKNEVYKVEQFGNTWKLIDTRVLRLVLLAQLHCEEKAFKEGKTVPIINKNGKKTL